MNRALGNGLHAWLSPNAGWGESNSLLVCGNGASLLVDTMWDLPRTRAMLQCFRQELGSAPIGPVVNTHADGDHWYGNELTGAREVIATGAAARLMARHGPAEMRALRTVAQVYRAIGRIPFRGGDQYRITAEYFDEMLRPFDFGGIRPRRASRTFEGKLTLEVGGRCVELIEAAPAHTSGDLMVHVPDEGVIATGDIVFAGCTPILWDGSATNWIAACELILKMNPSVVVPGHGPLTGPEGVEAIRRYWEFLWMLGRRHHDRGHTVRRAAEAIVLSDGYRRCPFAEWEGQERIIINLDAIYRRLAGRPSRLSTLERLRLFRQTAMMREFLRCY